MSPKIQKVCNLYLSGMSMRKALIAAGYSESYADHHSMNFLKNREVVAYIRNRQKEIEDATLADMIYVRAKLKKIADKKGVDEKDVIAATKILGELNIEMEKIQAKVTEIEAKSSSEATPIVINITPVEKPL